MAKHRIPTLTAAVLLALGTTPLLASCAQPSNSPSVASLAGATASASASPTSTLSPYQQALKFSSCMRTHGVPNFPDPQQVGTTTTGGGGGGSVQIKIGGNGVDPKSPQFQAAQNSCKQYMPSGPSGKQIGPGKGGNFNPSKVPAWAACIRHHGLPHFPDPKIVSGGMQLQLSGSGIDPTTMMNAMKACQSLFPGGGLEISNGSGGDLGVVG